jgi:hypothetical protein
MGYRDDFYVVDNIVGYTGDIKKDPTVYFESGEEYGHITQWHEYDWNIGREYVCSLEGYNAGNTNEGTDKVRLQESLGTDIIHVSRNQLISTEGMSAGDKDLLKQSIWKCQNEKSRYTQVVKLEGLGTRPRSNAVSR